MRSDRLIHIQIPLLILVLAILACNFPTLAPEATPTSVPTEPGLIASATAAGSPVPELNTPTSETTPTSTTIPTNTPIPSATATEQPCNRAEFVQDVTIPDGTTFQPNQDFTKTWRLRNTGTCTWDSDYDLVFVDGNSMGGASAVPISGSVSPGSTVDISIQLESPDDAGTYKGNYKLRSADGVLFGIGDAAQGVFWVEIRVVLPSSTPTTEVFLPDLVVSFIELDPSTPVRGNPVEVTIQVYNQGNAQAGQFIAQWWPGENYTTPACTWNLTSMNAGGGRVLSCTYAGYPSPYGSINTLAIADVNDSVDESDETNNELRMNISVVNP
jgi:hypothetical protein